MKRLSCLLGPVASLILAGCAGIGGPGANPSPLPPVSSLPPPLQNGTFDAARATQALMPAVGMVMVNTHRGVSTGSGFVISVQNGTSFMATNNHVVQGGETIQVLMPDGTHYKADVQGADSMEDIAVLKIAASLHSAQLADSSKAKVGQPVLAIGSPLGNQGTVTVGVISALHRTLSNVSDEGSSTAENLPDVLQTDAPINPGSSGGPLADGNGRVIGMTTAGAESANSVGYAIPSLVVRRIANSLIQGRRPGHPYAGVCYVPLEQALPQNPGLEGYGVLVTGTVPDGPAARAGVQQGDMIEKVDGVDLNNGQTLGGVIQRHDPGDTVPVSLDREGTHRDTRLTLADRPASPASC
jgi:S1-C subfamily serine protease